MEPYATYRQTGFLARSQNHKMLVFLGRAGGARKAEGVDISGAQVNIKMGVDVEAPLQRRFDDNLLAYINKNPLFEAMRHWIDKGNILPALRKQEVHFYEAGARLLCFTGKNLFTHTQYIDGKGDKDRPLKDGELNSATLEKIRCTSRKHRKPDRELVAVHLLFQEFAITRSQHCAGELALIDVEARFALGEKLPGGMIDLVFLLPDCRLLFIEAKCLRNPDVLSTTVARVVSQVRNYECHIKRDGVLEALNRSLCVQSGLVGRALGQAKCIVPWVPVLILDPDHRGRSPNSTDTWQKEALRTAPNWSPASGKVAVIDGTCDPARAIRAFVKRLPA